MTEMPDSRAPSNEPVPGRAPTIQRRILVRLVPLLIVIFAIVLYWLGTNLQRTLYAANLEIARNSNLMAVYAVETSMNTVDVHQPWDLITQRIPRSEGTDIEIIGTNGVVLFSTVPTKRGTVYDLRDPSCSECHPGGSSRATSETTFISTPRSVRELVFAAPLRNAEDCQSCHAAQGNKLGMVMVRQSLDPIDDQIRIILAGIAVAGGIALLMTILTTRVLLGRYLGRPLHRLLAGAEAIGAGDLQHRVELPDRTELTLLADTLNESTERFARLHKELLQQERLAAVGETVAGLAHCLKNLLNGLRAGQYVIDRAVELDDAKKLRTGWRVMKKGVGQVEQLTFDMLYYIKEREPELKPTNPNQIAMEIIDLLSESAGAQDVHLQADLDPVIGSVALDRTLIYRALLNLVTNAIDACTESETGDRVIFRSRIAAPDKIVLTVEDNGIGMSKEIQSMLFTRFFSTKSARGTGLGLSVVKKIAEEHGGSLDFESEPGKGSAFHIHLPLSGG
jgi:signal transduction histidine kinase